MNAAGDRLAIGNAYRFDDTLNSVGVFGSPTSTACPQPLDITIHAAPTIDLGADTTLICAGTSIALDAGTGFASYLWSDGSTNQTLSTSVAGTFTVTGTDANPANGCTVSDSMVVDILTVDIAQNDTTICEGDSLVLLLIMMEVLKTEIVIFQLETHTKEV